MQHKLVHYAIITIFVTLYALVATISMINSVAFFDLAHDGIMSWVLAIGFELGAAASLGAIIILDRTNKTMVWGLFILLTLFQMMANSFHAYINLEDYLGWIELFGLEELTTIEQKRVLSAVSGAILPLVALGFIKSLVDYIRPEQEQTEEEPEEPVEDSSTAQDLTERPDVQSALATASKLSKEAPATEEPTALANSEYCEQEQVEEKPAASIEQKKAEPKSVQQTKPSRQEAKKITPANSNGANVMLKSGIKAAPIAGSPSR